MRVNSEEIEAAFQGLISAERSRESVASWASELRALDDSEGLEYGLPSHASVIWDALEFLMGVDLKDGPESYLHNLADIETYWSGIRDKLRA